MYNELNPFVRLACEVSSLNIGSERKVGLDHRPFFVNSGMANIDIAGTEYLMSEGVLVYIPAGTDYAFRFSEGEKPMNITVINFDFDAGRSEKKGSIPPVPIESFSPSNLYNGYIPTQFEKALVVFDAESLGMDMKRLRTLFFNKDSYYRGFASAILKTLLLNMAVKAEKEKGITTAVGVINYIKQHYNERLLLTELAQAFNYHPNHVNRLVKIATGYSFKEFVIHYRIKVAKDRLISTADPVTAISQSCGFATASYFTEIFTRITGVNPREYRRSKLGSIV